MPTEEMTFAAECASVSVKSRSDEESEVRIVLAADVPKEVALALAGDLQAFHGKGVTVTICETA